MATAEELTLNIYNAALTMVGTQLLSGTREDTAQGFACRAWGTTAYNRAHTRVPWVQSLVHVTLDVDDATEVEYGNDTHWRFDQPDDFLRAWTWIGSRTYPGTAPRGQYIETNCYPPVEFSYMRKMLVTEVPDSFIEIVEVLLAEAIKPRFEKQQVSADALTLRQVTSVANRLIREAQAIELAQLPRRNRTLATNVGRSRYVTGLGAYRTRR